MTKRINPHGGLDTDNSAAGSKKLAFIRYFFVLGAGGAILAAYFDYQQGYTLVSIVEFLVGILALLFLAYSRGQSIAGPILCLTVIVVYALFTVAAFTQMDTVTSLVWVPAYPIIFFFLTHFRTGLFWSVLTLLTLTAAYLLHPYLNSTPRIPLEAFLQTCSAYIFAGTLAFFYEKVRSRQEEMLQYQADFDYLTGIYNRRGLTHHLDAEISRVQRYGTRLSLLLLDLDNFKAVNDSYGHKAGDSVLQEICQVTQGSIRKSDILARWGGEEFAVLMPEASLEEARLLAEKLRAMIADHKFQKVGRITVSIGVAQYHLPEASDDLLQRADTALYRAKALDKNRVEVEPYL